MARVALAVGSVGMLLLAALVVWPWFTKDRTRIASTPQPAPLFNTTLIPMPGGARACMTGGVIDELSEVARFRVGTLGKPGVPFQLTIRGDDGYRVSKRVPADYADNDLLAVPVPPPPEPTEVTICVRNAGRREVTLYASNEGGRTMTRANTTVDGKEALANFVMTFEEREPASVADRASTIARRAATFRPGGPWIVWAVAVLVLGIAPIALVASLVVAARRDEEDAGAPADTAADASDRRTVTALDEPVHRRERAPAG